MKYVLSLVMIWMLSLTATTAHAKTEQLQFDYYARGLGARLLNEQLKTDPQAQDVITHFHIMPRFGVAYVDLNNDKIDEVLAFFNDEYMGIYDGDNINVFRFSIYRVEKGKLVDIGHWFASRIFISDQRINGYYTFVTYDNKGKSTFHKWTGQAYD